MKDELNFARWGGSVLALGVTLVGEPAVAQESATATQVAQTAESDSAASLTEIVVTAQRRSQRLQDVGIAVAAYSGEDLRMQGVDSSIDVARITPGVFVSSSLAGQNSQFSIRGVTQNEISDTTEGPVAVYVDDTYVPTLQGQTFGLFDLERVEILKGPQGTLFGRNATGGLVHFIVAKPTDTPEGYTDVTYGRYNQKKIEAAFSGPLLGAVTGRASVYWDTNQGFMRNDYPAGASYPVGTPISPCCQNLGGQNTLGTRVQLQLQATPDLVIRASGSFVRQNLSTAPYNSVATVAEVDAAGNVIGGQYASPAETRIAIGPGGSNYTAFQGVPPARPAPGGDFFGFVPPAAKNLATSSDFARDDLNRTRSYDGALHIDYDFGGMKLAAISDYKESSKFLALDAEASPLNFVDVGVAAKTHSFSQEIRLFGDSGGVAWNAGVYYLRTNTEAESGFLAPTNSIFAGIFGLSNTGVDLLSLPRLRDSSISTFGQIEYKFAPTLTAVLGARAIEEYQRYQFDSTAYLNTDNYAIDFGTPLFPLQPSYSNRRSEFLWSGKAQLEYRPAAGFLYYVGINRGVKGGNYNSKLPDGTPPLAPDQFAYRPEVLVSYEGGAKTSFAGGAVVLNGSLYYYDYHDYQAFTFSNVSGYVQNRDARTYGAEADVAFRPVHGLEISSSISLLNAKVKDVMIAPAVFRDVKPTFSPDTQLGTKISYTLAALAGNLTFAGDGHYTSSFYQNIRNFDSQRLDGYGIFDAQISWATQDQSLHLTAAVNNIADKRYATTAFDLSTLCGCTEIAYGQPRWWSLTVGVRF